MSESHVVLLTELIVAIGTILLALATFALGYYTRALAEEARRERELEHQPYFTVEQRPGRSSAKIANIGGGPALNCRYCWYEPPVDGSTDEWWASEPFTIRQDAVDPARSTAPQTGSGVTWVQRVLKGVESASEVDGVPGRVSALVCEDELGILHRYHLAAGHPRPDSWRPGQSPPDWVFWPPRSGTTREALTPSRWRRAIAKAFAAKS